MTSLWAIEFLFANTLTSTSATAASPRSRLIGDCAFRPRLAIALTYAFSRWTSLLTVAAFLSLTAPLSLPELRSLYAEMGPAPRDEVASAFAVTPAQHQVLEIAVGFGIAGTGFGVILAVVGRAASDRHRSMALAIATAAGSAGQVCGQETV